MRAPLRAINRVWWVNAFVLVVVGLLYFSSERDLPPLATPHVPWWALALGFLVAERCVVHLEFQRSAHSFSLGDIPLVFGLLFASAPDLLIGGLLGTALTLTIDRRLSAIKLVFNLAQLALAISVATIVVHLLASTGGEIGANAWMATLLATQGSALITVLLIGVAVSLSEGPLRPQKFGQMLMMDSIVTITNTSLALAGAIIVATDARAIPLLVVPAVTVFLAYRAYLLERQRHERLEFLYETTRTLSRSPEVVLALEGLLARSLEAFRAELAEIVLFSSEGNPPLRTALGPGEHKELMQPIDDEVARDLRSIVSETTPAVRLTRPFGTDRLDRYLESRLVTDAMVAMLPGEKRVIGTIMLANRFGVIRSFSEDDLKLFETLANNASVALQFDRLEQAVLQLRELQEQLEHRAFHDPLTDLANRSLFINQVKDAIARDKDQVAVLFVDLDDFKTFNDSLGHVAGDELLVAVANRLRESVRPSDAVARLGGDEFAVLATGADGSEGSGLAVADRIVKAFEQPVKTADKAILVHLSIGIATSHDSTRADELIRDADLAMYRAKETGKAHVEVFQPQMRDAVIRRHGLKEELRQAIDREEMAVEYQPIIELASGEMVAVEALVRWNHPGRGRLLPSEFISLAEETGLISAIGRFVLAQACAQADTWQASPAGRPMAVHVNLSAVELQDAAVVDAVSTAIKESGIQPWQLVLEITESLVQDERSANTMRRLRNLGVRLALDDFGTGYSSLSYLRSLPLDILKIAKPFIEGINRRHQESSFVRMMLDLARTLDLKVIAEGIESVEELEALRELGCEFGQGFHIAPPLGLPESGTPAAAAGAIRARRAA